MFHSSELHVFQIQCFSHNPPGPKRNRQLASDGNHTFEGREDPFVCKVCRCQFYTYASLEQHESVHINQFVHVCRYCGKSFEHEWPLRVHERRHVTCLKCRQVFESEQSLEAHKKSHKASLACKVCRKNFSRRASLKKHERTHDK